LLVFFSFLFFFLSRCLGWNPRPCSWWAPPLSPSPKVVLA
jgi:hypothetical protein